MAWLPASIAYDLGGAVQSMPPLMPTCPLNHCPLDGLPEVMAASFLAVSWPEALEYLTAHAPAAVLIAGALGILVGWLAKQRSLADAMAEDPAPTTPGFDELLWRHEKLVLVERQQVEKQARLDHFAEAFPALPDASLRALALSSYLLAERVREARQKVGSDLSRMIAVRDRLDTLLPPLERGREAIGACRGMAEAQAVRLEEARDALRGIADDAVGWEESIRSGGVDLSDKVALRKRLVELKGRIVALPQGWATSSEETDRRIRELLATVNEPGLAPVREVLLVDGALTASLAGVPAIDLTGGVGAVIKAFDLFAKGEKSADVVAGIPVKDSDVHPERPSSEERDPGESGDTFLIPEGIPGALPDSDQGSVPGFDFGFPPSGEPDRAFRDPSDFALLKPRPSKGFHDLTGGANPVPGGAEGEGNGNGNGSKAKLSEALVADAPEVTGVDSGWIAAEPGIVVEEPMGDEDEGDRSLVLFCSNDVEIWGKTVYRGARCRARAISEFPLWAHWISIRRLDTGERVFAPLRSANLRTGQHADPFGFNGSNELFYGARHLGLFSESCPNEVETRFTYGGWGFGHRAHEIAPEVEQLQAAGWEGREIPADTVFEIVIHEELPALGPRDRLIEGEVRGKR